MNNKKAAALIFISTMILFLAGLYGQEFIRINCRFALFVMEMKEYGLQLFPTLNGKPYTDYPSTFIFLMYLSSLGGNFVNMLTITIPTAVAAALTLVMTYLIGARVSKWLGAYAVVLCLMSYEFVSIARAPSLDMFVALATVAGFYLCYTADRDNGWKRLLLLPLCLIAGFAIRGPIGIVIPSAVIFIYYLINLRWLMALMTAVVAGSLILGCMITLLGLCAYTGGEELVEYFLRDQIFSRMGRGKPPWYFFTNAVGSYAVTYPMALVVVGFYAKKLLMSPKTDDVAGHRLHFMRSITAWLFIVLLGMSIPGTKHLRYIVATVPAMGLLAAWLFLNFDNLKIFAKLQKYLLIPACKLAPFAALAFIIIGSIVLKVIDVDIALPTFIPALLFASLAALVWMMPKLVRQEHDKFILLLVLTLTVAVLRLMTIEPIEQYVESSRDFVLRVEKIRNNNRICYFDLGPDGDELKYQVNLDTPRWRIPEFIIPPRENKPSASSKPDDSVLQQKIIDFIMHLVPEHAGKEFQKISPMFIIHRKIDTIFDMPQGTIFVSKRKDFNRGLPDKFKEKLEIIEQGKMGHKEYFAFRLKQEDTTQECHDLSE